MPVCNSPVSHICPASDYIYGSVGQGLPNTECRIVDPETLEDLPIGEAGELLVRGPQVMQGYVLCSSGAAPCHICARLGS